MTYEEDYMNSKTLEELKLKINEDIIIAQMIGSSDRLTQIKKAGEKVANLKFKEEAR